VELASCHPAGAKNFKVIGRSGDRIPVGTKFSAPVLSGHGTHPASYTMGTGSLSRGLSGRGVALTTHPYLEPRLKKE